MNYDCSQGDSNFAGGKCAQLSVRAGFSIISRYPRAQACV
jgi:hypothetical protein